MEDLDVVIVGGGVAGLQAALSVAEAGVGLALIERLSPGGRVATLNELWDPPPGGERIGHELAAGLLESVLTVGVDVRFEEVTSVEPIDDRFAVRTASGLLTSRALIVATGTSDRPLGLPGEDAAHGHGLSTCAACDGPLHRGQHVVVVGGGDSGALAALELASYAARVTMVFAEDDLHCAPGLAERVRRSERIELQPDSVVCGLSQTGGIVDGVGLETPHGPTTVACSGVFSCGGLVPVNELFVEHFPCDQAGYASVDTHSRLAPGLFATGDVAANTEKSVRAAMQSARDCARAAVEQLS